jgi:tetratricopeptide (TPR) repeat protein
MASLEEQGFRPIRDVFVALEGQDPAPVARMNDLMRQACSSFNQGCLSEAIAPFEALLSMVREHSVPPPFLAWLLRHLGESLAYSGEYHRAAGFLDEAIEHYRDPEDCQGLARCLFVRGGCAGNSEQLEHCLELVRESRGIYEKSGDSSGVACTLCMEGAALSAIGQFGQGARLLIAARHLYQQAEDRPGEAEVLCNLSDVELAQGRLKSSEKCLLDALALARTDEATGILDRVLMKLGQHHARFGSVDSAEAYATEALTLYRACGNREQQAECLHVLSMAAWRRDDFSASLRHLAEVQGIQRARGDKKGLAFAVSSVAGTLLSMEEHEEASARYEEALAILGKGEDALATRAGCYSGLGAAICMLGRVREGRALFAQARRMFTRRGDWTLLMNDVLTEGECLIRVGLDEEGEALIRQGVEAGEPCGCLNGLPASQVIADKLAKIRRQMQKRKNGH